MPLVETSTRRARNPLAPTMSRMKLSSSPLVSSVPTTSTVGGPALRAALRRGAAARSPAASTRRSRASARRPRCARSARAATSGSAASDSRCRSGSAPSPASARRRRACRGASLRLGLELRLGFEWRPTPSRRCCRSRSEARRAESIRRLTRPLTMMATCLGDRRRHPDILLDDEHRDVALLAEPHQHVLDLGHDDGRQSFGRLVHDQETRIGHQRARDRQHLLLAAGELGAAIVLALGQAREGVVDALDGPRAAPHACDHAQVLVDGERAPQPPPLRHVADAEAGDLRRLQRQQILAAHAARSRRLRAPAP